MVVLFLGFDHSVNDGNSQWPGMCLWSVRRNSTVRGWVQSRISLPTPRKVSCGGGLCRFDCSRCICISLVHPTEPCGGRDDVRGNPVSGWPYNFRKVRHTCSVTYYTPFLWGMYLLSKRCCRGRIVVVYFSVVYRNIPEKRISNFHVRKITRKFRRLPVCMKHFHMLTIRPFWCLW
jgi:hypothetical protein